ncbi:prephenate dehydrogenase/arogenate dehydrogenase family protein [cyanobiont of Ornithocercus magnificus]|nr:prephenate dehydrogenase/arogenate dehydrogenase family protein [cyanobiont of Ornithocercus magnificus]
MKKKQLATPCVGVVGLGLIGGSISLGLQAAGWRVHGLAHHYSAAERAQKLGLVTQVSTNPAVLENCNVVVLALPLTALLQPEEHLVKALPAMSVVMDVGSVKAPILQVWHTLHPRFVASHPMAGTAQSGMEASSATLFHGCPWVITPQNDTDQDALKTVQRLASVLGSHCLKVDAVQHDRAVALVSHLPVFVSAALLSTVCDEQDPDIRQLAMLLASSGFADSTRIGGGNPELGTAMASYNRLALLKGLASYRCKLEQLEQIIISSDWFQLHSELTLTQNLRPSFVPDRLQS